jgi:hypothetical protein
MRAAKQTSLGQTAGELRTFIREQTSLGQTAGELRTFIRAKRTYQFHLGYPPGHYYSPIPSREERERGSHRHESCPSTLTGIDLREAAQLALAADFTAAHVGHPYGTSPHSDLRYRFANRMFKHGDAVILHAILRHFRPDRVVEVGSGFSSALMLDVNEQWLNGKIMFTFIEPYPDRLNSILKPGDRENVEIIEKPVQDVDPAIFEELLPGHFLFIDSSHVSKMGSDVHRLVFDVLPQLRSGVIVHFHDVFWPFEYPTEWADEGRAWNEDYLLRAFLTYNTRFEMLLFNNWLARVHPESLAPLMPSSEMLGTTSSLWLRVGA